MKRLIVSVFFVYLVVVLFSPMTADGDRVRSFSENTFVLPSSLTVIEEEAFSGTAVNAVVFPEGFKSIDSRAFVHASLLADVFIPRTTEYIADSAFPRNEDLSVHGIKGSYAEEWAYSHEIPFVVDNVWNVYEPSGRTHNIQTIPIQRYITTLVLIILFEFFRLSYYGVRSRRPQDRPELNPIDYRFP